MLILYYRIVPKSAESTATHPKIIYTRAWHIYEGNPKSVMEALALGCLVLASDIPNHKDLITDNKNGLLFELGSRDLNKKFFSVAEKNSKLTEISKNAYEESVKNYELSFIATKEFEDYILLLNQSR